MSASVVILPARVVQDGAGEAVFEVADGRVCGARRRDASGRIQEPGWETQDLAAQPPASLPRECPRGTRFCIPEETEDPAELQEVAMEGKEGASIPGLAVHGSLP